MAQTFSEMSFKNEMNLKLNQNFEISSAGIPSHEKAVILSRELKETKEKHISFIQFLLLEKVKLEKVINLLTNSNNNLKKELTFKEQQINTYKALTEEIENYSDEDINLENENSVMIIEDLKKQLQMKTNENECLINQNIEFLHQKNVYENKIENLEKMILNKDSDIQRNLNMIESYNKRNKLQLKQIEEQQNYISILEPGMKNNQKEIFNSNVARFNPNNKQEMTSLNNLPESLKADRMNSPEIHIVNRTCQEFNTNQVKNTRPRDSLNLFENKNQLNKPKPASNYFQRGICDFPIYDNFQRNKSFLGKLQDDLTRAIQNKNIIKSELARIPSRPIKMKVYI